MKLVLFKKTVSTFLYTNPLNAGMFDDNICFRTRQLENRRTYGTLTYCHSLRVSGWGVLQVVKFSLETG